MADATAALEAARAVRDELAAEKQKVKTLEARLLAMQRAASESQRLAAEAQEALDAARRELFEETGVRSAELLGEARVSRKRKRRRVPTLLLPMPRALPSHASHHITTHLT